MEAKLQVNVKAALNRYQKFYKEFNELCDKYKLEPQMAKDDETNDNFIVINVKDFVQKKDIDMKIEK